MGSDHLVDGRHLPLVVTADQVLLDELVGLAESVEVTVRVQVEPQADPIAWAGAPLILLGSDVAGTGTGARGLPAPQGRVVLVSRHCPSPGAWATARAWGADHVALLPEAAPWLASRIRDPSS